MTEKKNTMEEAGKAMVGCGCVICMVPIVIMGLLFAFGVLGAAF